MNKNYNKYLILKLLFIIVIFILLIVFDKNKDNFTGVFRNTPIQHDRYNSVGAFSVITVDDTSEAGYDLDRLGPSCVATCVAEHGANVLFTNPEGSIDPFVWNRENPRKGYCYRANSTSYPFNCDATCQEKCGSDLNNPGDSNGEYDPELDFSQCVYDGATNNCIENKLNFLSGQSCLTTVGCKLCMEKYIANIENMNNVFEEEVQESERCAANE